MINQMELDYMARINKLEDKINQLQLTLKPFAEVARRLNWDKLSDNSTELNEHIIEAPADDIAPGATCCLTIYAFRNAARTDIRVDPEQTAQEKVRSGEWPP